MSTSESFSDSSEPDLETIVLITKNCEFFKNLIEEQQSDEIHRMCCSVMDICEYFQGQGIIKFGEVGSNFYIILKGRVGVFLPRVQRGTLTMQEVVQNKKTGRKMSVFKYTTVDSKKLQRSDSILLKPIIDYNVFELVKEMGPGESFGEMALINNKPRAATVTAMTNTTLAVLSKSNFKKLIEKFTEKRIEEKIRFLKSYPMFHKCTKFGIMKLSFYFNVKRVVKGQVLYKIGDPTDGLYFITKGEFMVKSNQMSKKVELANQMQSKPINPLRRATHLKNVNLIVKSTKEIIGLQEIFDEEDKRQMSCFCVSNNSEVYYLSKQDLKARIVIPEAWNWLREKYEWEKLSFKKRVKEMIQVEKAKLSLNIRSLSEIGFLNKEVDKGFTCRSDKMFKKLMKHRRVASQRLIQ